MRSSLNCPTITCIQTRAKSFTASLFHFLEYLNSGLENFSVCLYERIMQNKDSSNSPILHKWLCNNDPTCYPLCMVRHSTSCLYVGSSWLKRPTTVSDSWVHFELHAHLGLAGCKLQPEFRRFQPCSLWNLWLKWKKKKKWVKKAT